MGRANINLCGKITMVAFIILNIFFLLIGLALIGGGSYLVHTGTNLDFFTGSNFFSGAVILIIAGIITVVITILGIGGAILLSKVLLGIYLIAVVLIVILEIVAGILGFVYRNQVTDQATDIATRALNEYRTPDSDDFDRITNDAIDAIQRDFTCCGWTGFSDWESTPYFVNDTMMMYPPSCECPADTTKNCTTVGDQNIYSTGCRDGVTEFFRNNLIAAGGIGVAFGLLQILAVLMAIGLCGCIFSGARDYTTV